MHKNNKLQAVLFDVDGTLADTEQDGHRLAFNAAFKEFNLTWDWDIQLYGELLQVTGGKERIHHYLQKYALQEHNKADLNDWVALLHKCKTKYFEKLLAQGSIPLRPGVARLIDELRREKIRLAIATTTTPQNVTALLQSTLGKSAIDWFEVIGAGDIVPQKKPAPDIYHWVLNQLNLEAQQCIAIEDSENGLQSALAAGLPTIITINGYTQSQNFTGALAVFSDLGEPAKPFTRIHGNTADRAYVDLQMLNSMNEKVI
jgi:beta-phosphoglucomutase-like phosphatase (HAD superfamily)